MSDVEAEFVVLKNVIFFFFEIIFEVLEVILFFFEIILVVLVLVPNFLFCEDFSGVGVKFIIFVVNDFALSVWESL